MRERFLFGRNMRTYLKIFFTHRIFWGGIDYHKKYNVVTAVDEEGRVRCANLLLWLYNSMKKLEKQFPSCFAVQNTNVCFIEPYYSCSAGLNQRVQL